MFSGLVLRYNLIKQSDKFSTALSEGFLFCYKYFLFARWKTFLVGNYNSQRALVEEKSVAPASAQHEFPNMDKESILKETNSHKIHPTESRARKRREQRNKVSSQKQAYCSNMFYQECSQEDFVPWKDRAVWS